MARQGKRQKTTTVAQKENWYAPKLEPLDEEEKDDEEFEYDDTGEHDDEGYRPAYSASLIGSPMYPNAIRWSEDNLIAVATSQIITILSPASIGGSRGFIIASSEPPFTMGYVQQQDMKASCLLPIRLARDSRAMIKSIDWSPQGLAPNGGCLLAVCSKNHRVKLYHAPYCEFRSEWIEVMDLTELLHRLILGHFNQGIDIFSAEGGFDIHKQDLQSSGDQTVKQIVEMSNDVMPHITTAAVTDVMTGAVINHSGQESLFIGLSEASLGASDDSNPMTETQALCLMVGTDNKSECELGNAFTGAMATTGNGTSSCANRCSMEAGQVTARASSTQFSDNNAGKEPPIHNTSILNGEGVRSGAMSPLLYAKYASRLACVVVSWSPKLKAQTFNDSILNKIDYIALIAIGAKSGDVYILRVIPPADYNLEKASAVPSVTFVGVLEAHKSWVSAFSWSKGSKVIYDNDGVVVEPSDQVFLATGSCDGSVKLWAGNASDFLNYPSTSCCAPFALMKKVVVEDFKPVTTISLMLVVKHTSECLQIAIGKASGEIMTFNIDKAEQECREACCTTAHSQLVTGVVWAFDGQCLFSSGQDDSLRVWMFLDNELLPLSFPHGTLEVEPGCIDNPCDLSNSVLEGYFGVDMSKGNLMLATVRGVSAELVDPMYQSRSLKAMAQLLWVGNRHLKKTLSTTETVDARNKFQDQDLAQCKSRVLTALHFFENTEYPLNLWDIVTCLASMSSNVGRGFLDSVVSQCLSDFGIEMSKFHNDHELILPEYSSSSLSNITTRCLQILVVLIRRLYLAPVNDRPSSVSMPLPTGSSGILESAWSSFLSDIEHELRQRLVLVTLEFVIQSLDKAKSNTVENDIDLPSITCIVQWAAENSVNLSPQVLAVVEKVAKELEGSAQTEFCTLCEENVPFASTETGECQGSACHKFPRCTVSFKICTYSPLWFCHCCARWAAKQTPSAFLTLNFCHIVDQLDECHVQPVCPFCGILLQKLLPDCFLRSRLV